MISEDVIELPKGDSEVPRLVAELLAMPAYITRTRRETLRTNTPRTHSLRRYERFKKRFAKIAAIFSKKKKKLPITDATNCLRFSFRL